MSGTRARHHAVQILVLVVLIVADLLVAAAMGSAAPAKTLTVLQLNLCNSGKADCFKKLNNDKSVGEAVSKINAMKAKPDVITLNEVCRNDVATIAGKTGYKLSGSNFFPVRRRLRGGSTTNYKCKNRRGYQNEDYGIGFLVRNHGDQVRTLVYRQYDQQDGSDEVRVMACAEYAGLDVCTTHLSVHGDIAKKQCGELKSHAATYARARPTVVAGDFNLSAADAQKPCVPNGFFRKGDGAVQHIMASAQFAFVSRKSIDLKHTDHDGWMVTVRFK